MRLPMPILRRRSLPRSRARLGHKAPRVKPARQARRVQKATRAIPARRAQQDAGRYALDAVFPLVRAQYDSLFHTKAPAYAS